MKKILFLFIVIVLASCSTIAADEMGVKIISKDNTNSSAVSLDDLQLNVDVTIDGYGILNATSFEFFDWLGHYAEGVSHHNNYGRYTTGREADFAMLRMDITNRMTKEKNFLDNVKVKVIFEDYYEYEGWYYQFNYDNQITNNSNYYYDWNVDGNKQNTKWVISKKDNFAIKPMYTGHYVFGCTLPNAIINSKSSLRMEITLDGNIITYNIRK